jgi:DNA polymerase
MKSMNAAQAVTRPEWAALNADIHDCIRCRPELNIQDETESAPGYGSKSSRVVVVGQSLCKLCMKHHEPFRGGSERFIKAALNLVGRVKEDVFTTNVVHCHPPGNRPSRTKEIEHCSEYLYRELDLVGPRLVIGLGRDERAHVVLRAKYPDVVPLEWWPGDPPLSPTGNPALVFFPHPSWVKFQPTAVRDEWVADLAAVIEWGFR